jgi:hypothetical protein
MNNRNIAYKSFEIITRFRCLEITQTNQNHMLEEMKCRLVLGSACHQFVQKVFPSIWYLKT